MVERQRKGSDFFPPLRAAAKSARLNVEESMVDERLLVIGMRGFFVLDSYEVAPVAALRAPRRHFVCVPENRFWQQYGKNKKCVPPESELNKRLGEQHLPILKDK